MVTGIVLLRPRNHHLQCCRIAPGDSLPVTRKKLGYFFLSLLLPGCPLLSCKRRSAWSVTGIGSKGRRDIAVTVSMQVPVFESPTQRNFEDIHTSTPTLLAAPTIPSQTPSPMTIPFAAADFANVVSRSPGMITLSKPAAVLVPRT